MAAPGSIEYDSTTVTADVMRIQQPSEFKTTTENWQRAGVTGHGVMTLGRHGAETRFSMIKFGNYSTVQAFAQDVEAASGREAVLTDPFGTVHENMFIDRVGPRQLRAAHPQGYRVELRLEARQLNVPTP